MPSRFWLPRGWVAFSESVKKGKFVTKIFFFLFFSENENFWKMIPADVKTYIKQEIKVMVGV